MLTDLTKLSHAAHFKETDASLVQDIKHASVFLWHTVSNFIYSDHSKNNSPQAFTALNQATDTNSSHTPGMTQHLLKISSAASIGFLIGGLPGAAITATGSVISSCLEPSAQVNDASNAPLLKQITKKTAFIMSLNASLFIIIDQNRAIFIEKIEQNDYLGCIHYIAVSLLVNGLIAKAISLTLMPVLNRALTSDDPNKQTPYLKAILKGSLEGAMPAIIADLKNLINQPTLFLQGGNAEPTEFTNDFNQPDSFELVQSIPIHPQALSQNHALAYIGESSPWIHEPAFESTSINITSETPAKNRLDLIFNPPIHYLKQEILIYAPIKTEPCFDRNSITIAIIADGEYVRIPITDKKYGLSITLLQGQSLGKYRPPRYEIHPPKNREHFYATQLQFFSLQPISTMELEYLPYTNTLCRWLTSLDEREVGILHSHYKVEFDKQSIHYYMSLKIEKNPDTSVDPSLAPTISHIENMDTQRLLNRSNEKESFCRNHSSTGI